MPKERIATGGQAVLSLALATATSHAAMAVFGISAGVRREVLVAHGILAVAFAVAGLRLGELAAAEPVRAAALVWSLLALDLGVLVWSAAVQNNLRLWIARHTFAMWALVGAALLVWQVRRRSAAAAVPSSPAPAEGPSAVRRAWDRTPPRVRGLLLVAIGLALLKGAAILFSARADPVWTPDADSKDPLGILFAPGFLLAAYGVVQLVLGRPFAQWSGAWDEMPEGEQRLVVYGILFGSPVALYLLFRYLF